MNVTNISIQHTFVEAKGPAVEVLINDKHAGHILLQIASDGMWKFYAYGANAEKLGKHWNQGDAMAAVVSAYSDDDPPTKGKPDLKVIH